jgi:hypothetical protein
MHPFEMQLVMALRKVAEDCPDFSIRVIYKDRLPHMLGYLKEGPEGAKTNESPET